VNAKKAMLLVGVALVVFYVVVTPDHGAAVFSGIVGWLGDGLDALVGAVGRGGV
jgi:hypothetical protein